jgi:flavin reductase (DIM6/NTAB) family NADH-FMN oxidoreductase RutF
MNGFVQISPEELGNAIKCIGKDWMLITVPDRKNGRDNAMTASWGAMGVLWNKNICICFVRPQRHTYSLLEEEQELSIAFLGEDQRGAHTVCGRESGRDCDKLAKCGLTTTSIDGVPVINEAQTVLICKKLYEDDLREDSFLDAELLSNYPTRDYHRFYVCEIKKVYKKGE